jgi:hypothetical protein
MMNKRIQQLLPILLMLLVAACSDNEVPPRQQFPFVPVDVEINLQDLRYQNLHNEGWLYVDGGVHGLLIIKEGANLYRAFDRACPYHPREACAVVSMHSSTFYLVDDCCGSQFDKSGNVTKGPALQPLFQYTTYQNGNFLIIRNE